MPVWKAAVHIPSVSGLPRDDVVNTMYYSTTGTPTSGNFDGLGGIIAGYYIGPVSGHTDRVDTYMAQDRDYSTNAAKVDFYQMPSTPGPEGSPVHTFRWTMEAPSLSEINLPDQVACCQSYQADLTGVSNPRKYRGRFFVGPLNVLALEEAAGAGASQTVNPNLVGAMNRAAQTYLKIGAEATTGGFTWVMFSRTDWVAREVVKVSVDDRFDTQRRRLLRTTGRTSVTL